MSDSHRTQPLALAKTTPVSIDLSPRLIEGVCAEFLGQKHEDGSVVLETLVVRVGELRRTIEFHAVNWHRMAAPLLAEDMSLQAFERLVTVVNGAMYAQTQANRAIVYGRETGVSLSFTSDVQAAVTKASIANVQAVGRTVRKCLTCDGSRTVTSDEPYMQMASVPCLTCNNTVRK